MCASSIVAAEMAVIDAGTSRRFSERFRAVTTISTRLSSFVAPDAMAFSSAAKDTVALKAAVNPSASVARPTPIPTPRPAREWAGRRIVSLIISPPDRRFYYPYRPAQPRVSVGSGHRQPHLLMQTFAIYARFTKFASSLQGRSIPIGYRQFLRGKQCDDFATPVGDDQFLLDARSGAAIRGGAVSLERKHHALFDLEGVIERDQARDNRPLVERDAEAVAELQREGFHFIGKAELLGARKHGRDFVGPDARPDLGDPCIHPFARLGVGILLRIACLSHCEGAVVAGAIAHVGLDDVEEGLIAGTDDAVGKIVGVRAAALAGHGVDRLDVIGAHFEQPLGRHGDDIRLAHPRFEGFINILVDAVDHGGGSIQQHDFVTALDFTRIEHDLLAVHDRQAEFLQCEQHWRLDHIDTQRHAGDALLFQHVVDFLCRTLDQTLVGRNGAAQTDIAGVTANRLQPGSVNAVMGGGGAKIPQMGLPVAGKYREAAEFIARPLADSGGGDVADVVVVEAQQCAESGIADGLPGAAQAVTVETPKIDALLEIDIHDPMSVEARPIVMRIDILGPDLEAVGDGRLCRFAARGLGVLLLLFAHVLL